MKGRASHTAKATLVRVAGITALAADAGGGLPRRMKALDWGENPNAHGRRVFVGDKLVRAFSAPTYPFRTVPLDFEHNTLPGTKAYAESKEPRPVAAHCSVEVVPGEGVFLNVTRWTPEGEKNAPNFCDLSAAPVLDADGEVVAVMSVALCRVGSVPGMEFAEAALSLNWDALGGLINPKEDDDVEWKKQICELLGLDPAATSDEDAAKALKEQLAAGKEAVKKLAETKPADAKPADAEPAPGAGAEKPLAEQVAALSALCTGLQADLARRDKQAVIDGARREGKVVALNASAVDAMSLADLRDHVGKLPVTVPLSARTPSYVPETAPGVGPTPAQREVAQRCGMDPAAVFGGQKEGGK